jgi:hypothetical protein
MHVKQLPRWASKKGPRQPGQHLMRMRKLFGPTNPHAKYDRALFNKGNPPPKGLMYWMWNRGGTARLSSAQPTPACSKANPAWARALSLAPSLSRCPTTTLRTWM